MFPAQTKAFLKNVFRLNQEEKKIAGMTIPADLLNPENRQAVNALVREDFVRQLIDQDGRLNLTRAGIRKKWPVINLVPRIRKPTLAQEVTRVELARERIIDDRESAYGELSALMLFQAILIARVELYALGEERSAAKRNKNQVELERKSAEMKVFAGQLIALAEAFPFKEVERIEITADMSVKERQEAVAINKNKDKTDIKKKLKDAAEQLITRYDNPAADAGLRAAMDMVRKVLAKRREQRIKDAVKAAGEKDLGWKIKTVDIARGVFEVKRFAYKKDKQGNLVKELQITRYEHIQEFLNSFDEIGASETAEQGKNSKKIGLLKEAAASPLAYFDQLFELSLALDRRAGEVFKNDQYLKLRDEYKRKAVLEVGGAVKLCGVPDPQAHGLAASLLRMAAGDYEDRNLTVGRELEHNLSEKIYAATLVERVIKKMVEMRVEFFAEEPELTPANLRVIKEQAKVYFGTLFETKKGEKELDWIARCRSHIQTVIHMINDILPLLQGQKELAAQIFDPEAPWNIYTVKASAADRLKKRGLLKQHRDVEDELDNKGYAGLAIKIARELLLIAFEYENRETIFAKGQRQKAIERYFNEQAKIYNSKIGLPAIY